MNILNRSPVGHYRSQPICAASPALSKLVIEPAGTDSEEEAYDRNGGSKLDYYRVAIPMAEIWPQYVGSPRDGLRIEIYETED